ncbi:MAG: hypothetical protein J6Y24_08880 [Bacteroidales bacterium]|nr:hypothetical protein [Bacteroidales bacterium]MBP5502887.1 hypothetical protein [Bacteroidales bacterium]
MNAELAPAMAFDTISLNIPKTDLTFFKTLAKKMGWVINKKSTPRKKRLYDPETGEYLNDETMKAIEDDSVAFSGSFEDFKKWAQNL